MNAENPIDHIEWRHVDTLSGNSYNPNICHSMELDLLERSLLMTGWVQPILITADGTIVDGFHRFMLSKESPSLRARFKGLVPCAVLAIDKAEAMIITIRMNRAKGSHVALRMADIIQELIDVHGKTVEEIMRGIGATKDEIDLLYQNNVFKARDLDNYRYGQAWQSNPVTKEEAVQIKQDSIALGRRQRLTSKLKVGS